MTANTAEERLRELLAVKIGYEMLAEGHKTGTDISYGVNAWLRDPKNRTLVLEGLGFEVIDEYEREQDTVYHLSRPK
jgi:hypothetical protein